MTITDAQIEAAAAVIWKGHCSAHEPLPWSDLHEMDRTVFRRIARAALEAGEAAKKEKVRPETREWWPDSAFSDHYLSFPTPPTEGDR